MMEKPASQVLEEAAEILERDGWCQGMFHDGEGRHCALGAIRSFTDSEEYSFTAAAALAEYVNVLYIPHWNDRPERTQQEVIDAMIATAKELRDRGE